MLLYSKGSRFAKALVLSVVALALVFASLLAPNIARAEETPAPESPELTSITDMPTISGQTFQEEQLDGDGNPIPSPTPTPTSTKVEAITVREIPNLNIVSEQSTLPITISNTFSIPKQVFLDVICDSVKLDVDNPHSSSLPITVEANSELKVSVPVHVRANGDASLHIVLRSMSGEVYSDFWVPVMMQTVIGLTLGILFILLILLLVVFGTFRTIKAHKTKQDQKRISSNMFGIKK